MLLSRVLYQAHNILSCVADLSLLRNSKWWVAILVTCYTNLGNNQTWSFTNYKQSQNAFVTLHSWIYKFLSYFKYNQTLQSHFSDWFEKLHVFNNLLNLQTCWRSMYASYTKVTNHCRSAEWHHEQNQRKMFKFVQYDSLEAILLLFLEVKFE